MKSKYIQFIKELNISESNELIFKLESNIITFEQFENEIMELNIYPLRIFEKELKIQELLNENKS